MPLADLQTHPPRPEYPLRSCKPIPARAECPLRSSKPILPGRNAPCGPANPFPRGRNAPCGPVNPFLHGRNAPCGPKVRQNVPKYLLLAKTTPNQRQFQSSGKPRTARSLGNPKQSWRDASPAPKSRRPNEKPPPQPQAVGNIDSQKVPGSILPHARQPRNAESRSAGG